MFSFLCKFFSYGYNYQWVKLKWFGCVNLSVWFFDFIAKGRKADLRYSMKRSNQRQKRIKFDSRYYVFLKDLADSKGLNFYELTEEMLFEFYQSLTENGIYKMPMLKPTLKEVVKSIWISEDQMKEIVEPLSLQIGVSSNTFIYTMFAYYKIKNYSL